MNRSKKRIAIIGGGITGLTTAYRIKKKLEKENLPFELILLEGSLKIGGKIYTMKVEDRYLDLGATSIDVRYPEAIQLIKELGLEDQLIYSEGGKPDIFFYNQLHQLNYPTYKGIPYRKSDIWKNHLLTFPGKLATYRDAVLPSQNVEKDMELSTYLKHRLGDEMVEHIVEPFFSKIYASDLDEMGIKASKETIYNLEQKYGSISKGLSRHPELMDGSGNFVTFKEGLSVLTNKLEEILAPHIQYSKKVFEIRKGNEGTYIIDINRKEQVRVGAVCVATPTTEYSKFFKQEKLMNVFNQISTASVGYIVFSFPKGSLTQEPQGYGIVTPRRSDSFVTSVAFLNKKWPSLQASEDILIGVSFGRKGEDLLVSLSNKEIEAAILKDIESMIGITEPPKYRVVKRWPNAIPQYSVHQQEIMSSIDEVLKEEYPGVYIAGNGIGGFGISQCVSQGNQVGEKIVEYVKNKNVY